MKMIEGCTLLITPYAIFMVIFHVLLHNLIRQDMTLRKKPADLF